MRIQLSILKVTIVTTALMLLLLLSTTTSLAAPPTNDNFANAITIGSLPFGNVQDIFEATREDSEPASTCGSESKTIWYAFTPSQDEWLSANAYDPDSSFFGTGTIAAYTGSSLGSLTETACGSFAEGTLIFRAEAGTTYYFQVAGEPSDELTDTVPFSLEVTPLPEVSFIWDPLEPSTYDIVYFNSNAYDPAGREIASQTWDFGDGATATGTSPTHQYAADGDYLVQLTATTSDGRTSDYSQFIHISTHDVAITSFTAPLSARAGQTHKLSVSVVSKFASETVEVQLFKSVPGGFKPFGKLTQLVPERSSNRTISFPFSYTFTNDDARIGQITFKAVANIVNAPDELPADNEAIASPTKVRR